MEDQNVDKQGLINNALGCTPQEFYKRYTDYKKAEAKFSEVFEPFKENLIELHKEIPDLENVINIGGVKLTYVGPGTRSTLDTKKLKEEEPEIAKKFTKNSDVKPSVRINGI